MKRRKISRGLLKESVNKKITIILGARQVGKTTLLKALYERLCKGNDGLFLDLDVFSNFEKISSFENLKNTLFLNGYREKNKSFFYLFLDEFQRHNDLPMIMKNVYDNLDNVKIYASGSSSLKIKEQIQESLAGRKRIYRLHPLDFEEFLWFKDDKEALKQLSHIKKLSGENLLKVTSRLYSYLKEFMVFGGYPEVVLQDTNKKKAQVLESIFDLYVKKDLIEYLKVEKVLNAKRLIEYLAINNGQKIQYAELSQISSLDYQQVVSYIEILKETYLLAILRPFFTNKNKELVKIPKLYFLDNGVRNYFINNFNELDLRADKGFLFEGYVISELVKCGVKPENIKFWQDKNRHEVDIVIDTLQKQIPVEVKCKSKLKSEDFIGIEVFQRIYNSRRGYLVNLAVQEKRGRVQIALPYDLAIDRC